MFLRESSTLIKKNSVCVCVCVCVCKEENPLTQHTRRLHDGAVAGEKPVSSQIRGNHHLDQRLQLQVITTHTFSLVNTLTHTHTISLEKKTNTGNTTTIHIKPETHSAYFEISLHITDILLREKNTFHVFTCIH